MLRIRLQRVGARNQPHFRIVVTDRRAAAKGQAVAVIGQYRPDRHPKLLELDKEAARGWLQKGAQPSDTMHNLMVDLGVLKEKRNIKYARAKPVEEVAAATPVAEKTEAATAPSSESAAVEPTPEDKIEK